MNIAILILAAGSSTRMGTIKQLLPVGNTTLLGITIENALKSNATKVYCVLGANFEAIRNSISNFRIEIIRNSDYENGLSTSISRGIEEIMHQDYDAILMVLADQPFINSETLNSLIQVYLIHPEKIVASSYESQVGIPVLIPKNYYSEFLKLSGDKGAKHFLNTNRDKIFAYNIKNLTDIDTKEDYQELLNSEKAQ